VLDIAFRLAHRLPLNPNGPGKLRNCWVDLMRGTMGVLLPVCLMLSLLFVQQGTVQNVKLYVALSTLEGAPQTLAMALP
jgi:potassium-transporting ATPase potassium-binding subunit